MERPSILFLTDLSNDNEDEDIVISNYLHKYFHVILCHPGDCREVEDLADIIIIRNTWNVKNFGCSAMNVDRDNRERFYFKKLNVHDDLHPSTGEEKDYLLDLFKQGYPTIPTIDNVDDLMKLPSSELYFIKPKDGFDALGTITVERHGLSEFSNTSHYLIQPYLDFAYELSFYYLDKRFQYALYAPNKSKRWDLTSYKPNKSDITFAELFLGVSKQRYGIERIDACRMRNGGLLLMEITNQGGAYLSIPQLELASVQTFLYNLKESLMGRIFNR